MKSLYLCYFGLREPLVQTQVVPYLRELSKAGIEVSLLTFEPDKLTNWNADELASWESRLGSDGIRWFSLPYHKRPSAAATMYDIFAGAKFVVRLARTEGLDVLHARAHMPMAMAMLARKMGADSRLIFDIRGLMAEEYSDAGIWKVSSPVFKAVKKLEREGIRTADQIVVLSNRMRDWIVEQEMAQLQKIHVIPCCVQLDQFDRARNSDPFPFEDSQRYEVVYSGSVTGLYLLEEMREFFLEIKSRRPDAFFRILTKSVDAAKTILGKSLSEDDFAVETVLAEKVASYLVRANLGLSFRKPAFSQIAASPTKVAEYLAAGLPVVATAGVGDLDFIERDAVGIILQDLTPDSYRMGAMRILELEKDPSLKARCKAVAKARFDLATVGSAGYREVYHRIATS